MLDEMSVNSDDAPLIIRMFFMYLNMSITSVKSRKDFGNLIIEFELLILQF